MLQHLVRKGTNLFGFELTRISSQLSDLSASQRRIIMRARPFTMTSLERIAALVQAVEYTVKNKIPGAFVECGVWKGGSSMAAALTYLAKSAKGDELRCCASIGEARRNLESTMYPSERLHLVQGMVEQMIPLHGPEQISILRLDTDWHSSTKHELTHLFPRLSKHGVLIIDDYGHWTGARKAVDEYFAEQTVQPLLNRIDQTGRSCIKV